MVKKANSKAVTVILSEPDEKKHVVKLSSDEDGAAMSSAYITKAAMKELGNPGSVKITIEAA